MVRWTIASDKRREPSERREEDTLIAMPGDRAPRFNRRNFRWRAAMKPRMMGPPPCRIECRCFTRFPSSPLRLVFSVPRSWRPMSSAIRRTWA